MAQIIITDAKVRIDSSAATYTDISNNVRRVVITYNAETADDTVMGDATRSSKGGLKTWTVDIEMLNDYVTAEIDLEIFAIVGTVGSIAIMPISGTVGANTAEYQGEGLCLGFNPIDVAVGDLAVATVRFTSAGNLTRAVA